MVGPMGSGKTTLALKIAKDKNANYYSLDKTIKKFNVPIRNINDYEIHMVKALEMIRDGAIQALRGGIPVVLDFGGGLSHWEWLKNIADSTNAFIEIYHFDVPLEVRLARVKKRNEEKPKDIFHFVMNEEEVIASKSIREPPPPSDKVKIIKIESNEC